MMAPPQELSWWQRLRLTRRARRVLRGLFDEPDLLRGTSLQSRHRRRVYLQDFETDDGELAAVVFTILRHPRPYPFSRQHHEVMELYRYDVRERHLSRQKGLNLSRLKGRDGEPGGGWG